VTTILRSAVVPASDTFKRNREAMLTLVAEFRDLEARVRALSESKRPTFEKRGQLLPQERVALLLDRSGPYLELSTLAGLGMHEDNGKDNVLGGGICGIGEIAGVRCLVTASNSAIKGGTVTPMGVEKTLRAQEIARRQKLPVVSLVESGGANLLYQSAMFVRGGASFANQARLSAAGIPQINVVHGSSTAGGAYLPGLSDYVIMVRGRAKVFLAGPPLLRAATGEIATDEELGGADMHASVSGVADYVADDDVDAIRQAREIVANLRWNERLAYEPERSFEEPLYDPDELAGVVPADFRIAYDVREVIARIVDGSAFTEFKANYGSATVCGQAAICGFPCGIVTNNGPIDADGAAKAAQFIQLMCQAQTPLVYLQNTTGYLVGVDAERRGIVKHGSKMIQAVSNATVPQLTLHIGASFGAGNYGMCGRGFDPDFIFAWPNNRIAVMGGEQAARVMTIIAQDRAARDGSAPDDEKLEFARKAIVAQFDRESTALFATARLWDDGLIDPRDSRKLLGLLLSICRQGRRRTLSPTTFGVARM
jgi:geranyl-CoA carboxylase beta subunit